MAAAAFRTGALSKPKSLVRNEALKLNDRS